jgi:hypothetical protein
MALNTRGETPLDAAKASGKTRAAFIISAWPHIAKGCVSQKFNKAWKDFAQDPTRQFVSENADDVFKRIRMQSLQHVAKTHFEGSILDKDDAYNLASVSVAETFGDKNYHLLATEDLSNVIVDVLGGDQTASFGDSSFGYSVNYVETGLQQYSQTSSASTMNSGGASPIKASSKNVKVSIALKAPSRMKKLGVRLDKYLTGEADAGFRDRQPKGRPTTSYHEGKYQTQFTKKSAKSKTTGGDKGHQLETGGWATHYSQSNRRHFSATQVLSSVHSQSSPELASFKHANRPATSMAILRHGPVNDSRMLTQLATPQFVADETFVKPWTLSSPMLKLVPEEAKSKSLLDNPARYCIIRIMQQYRICCVASVA